MSTWSTSVIIFEILASYNRLQGCQTRCLDNGSFVQKQCFRKTMIDRMGPKLMNLMLDYFLEYRPHNDYTGTTVSFWQTFLEDMLVDGFRIEGITAVQIRDLWSNKWVDSERVFNIGFSNRAWLQYMTNMGASRLNFYFKYHNCGQLISLLKSIVASSFPIKIHTWTKTSDFPPYSSNTVAKRHSSRDSESESKIDHKARTILLNKICLWILNMHHIAIACWWFRSLFLGFWSVRDETDTEQAL